MIRKQWVYMRGSLQRSSEGSVRVVVSGPSALVSVWMVIALMWL